MRKHAVFLAVCGLVLLAPMVLAATEAVAAPPVHLQGSDSVETTQAVVDAFGAGLVAQKYMLLDPLYGKDLVYDDFCFIVHVEFRPWILWQLRRDLRQVDSIRVLAGHADRGWGVIEHTWDYRTVHGIWLQPFTVLEIRDGQIVYEAWYQPDPFVFPDGKPLEPTPLATPPRPSDTSAAAEAVALRYALALQAKDAGAMAAMSAPKIAFIDTATGSAAGNPGQVQAQYTRIFGKPADLVIGNLRYICGPGWAAVLWTASAESSGSSGEGATMLEMRDGRIARETLYYSSGSVPFGR